MAHYWFYRLWKDHGIDLPTLPNLQKSAQLRSALPGPKRSLLENNHSNGQALWPRKRPDPHLN